MKTTIALRKTNEANKSKTRFAKNCNWLIINTSDVHRLMRELIQQRNIHSNGGAFNVNPGITHELLQKVYEGLQVAVSSQTLPGHINPTIYAKMIAEIQEHALNEQSISTRIFLLKKHSVEPLTNMCAIFLFR